MQVNAPPSFPWSEMKWHLCFISQSVRSTISLFYRCKVVFMLFSPMAKERRKYSLRELYFIPVGSFPHHFIIQ